MKLFAVSLLIIVSRYVSLSYSVSLKAPCIQVNVSIALSSTQNLIANDYTIISADDKYITAIKYHPPGLNWNEARKACFREGGFLAYEANKEEEDLFLKIMSDRNVEDIWTGFHDLYQQGDYSTVLGEVASEAGYFKWRPGQPDNIGGNERCTNLHYDGLGLNDRACDAALYAFICKKRLPYCL